MDHHRNLCLLPSNAPSNVEHNFIGRGVLRDTSGNVQSGVLENLDDPEDESFPSQLKDSNAQYPSQSSISSECQPTINSLPSSSDAAPISTASSKTQRVHFRREYRRCRSAIEEDEAGMTENIRLRNRRFPILTPVERRSEKYLKYRSRQRRNLGKDGNVVWSDILEEAFQRGKQPPLSLCHVPELTEIALRAYRPLRRQKDMLYGEQKGSNEWISHYIKQMTGITRKRKQISSHIQVLKHFMSDNTECRKTV